MISDELVEKWAIKLALGNNGGRWINSNHMPEPGVKDHNGSWAGHYSEDHKQFWRHTARQALTDMKEDICET